MKKYLIDLMALFIAVLALFLTIWQAKISREHNILSVRPHLVIAHPVLAKISSYSLKSNTPLKYILSNEGLGPAKIKQVYLVYNKKNFPITTIQDLKLALLKAGINFDPYWGFTIPTKGEYISAGGEEMLLSFPRDSGDKALLQKLLKVLPLISFKVEYESIYEESFITILPGS